VHLVNASVLEEWNALSDAQVTAQVLTGRRAVFEVLMRRHNERVYRRVCAMVGNDGNAGEVLHQAYINAYANIRKFDSTTPFATWLTRMPAKGGRPRSCLS
jgi:RNA polymerase sigma-70 factor (ECF subfamily)